jgi:hypothetical protein
MVELGRETAAHLWRLSETLYLKPAGGPTCHSASSFCSRLQAILLSACPHHAKKGIFSTNRAREQPIRRLLHVRRIRWIGGEGVLGFDTFRDAVEELVMVRRSCRGRGKRRRQRRGRLLWRPFYLLIYLFLFVGFGCFLEYYICISVSF